MRSLVLAGLLAGGVMAAGVSAPASAQAACAYAGGAQTLPVPGRPFGATASADGCWLFVSVLSPEGPTDKGGGLAVLHNQDGRFSVAQRIALPGGPGGLALSHDGSTLVVAAEDEVAVLDVAKAEAGAADAVVAHIHEESGAGAIYVALSKDDRLLFISEERRARLRVLDMGRVRSDPAKAEIGAIPQGRAPVGLALSADGARLYATSEIAPATGAFPTRCESQTGRGPQTPEGLLTVIDMVTAATKPASAVVAIRSAGCGAVRVALSPDGATAWVTARGDDQLQGFATQGLKGVAQTPAEVKAKVGQAPVGVAVRPDGAQVWVANSDRFARNGQGSLTAVSPAGEVLKTVPSGAFPRDLSFLPDGKTLVVAEFGGRAIQFVPTDAP